MTTPTAEERADEIVDDAGTKAGVAGSLWDVEAFLRKRIAAAIREAEAAAIERCAAIAVTADDANQSGRWAADQMRAALNS